MSAAYVVDVARTPFARGKAGGALAGVHPVSLLAGCLRSLVDRVGLDPAEIDDAYVGCVSQVGEQSLNVGRAAVLAAGLPEQLPATTIDRQCGSSMQALAFAVHAIGAGAADVVLVGGVESMSRVPLWSSTLGADPYGPEVARRHPGGLIEQGIAAELTAVRWGIERAELDAYARESHSRARRAWDDGVLDAQVTPLEASDGTRVARDETVRAAAELERLDELRPAFRNEEAQARFPQIDWRVTAGSSSPLTDGAAAALIVSERALRSLGLTPLARVHATAVAAEHPIDRMLMAVVPATLRVLERAGLSLEEIDAFEVNEAFACVPLAWQRELGVDAERLNPLGGAIAYGHPLGASGVRLLGSAIAALRQRDGRYGLQVICEAGGMANATIIERMS
ncbi:thiolase family protein [Conexibacter woesei]|uniref:Acetyl-CoA acetyltransferase n=1 Tax=Conexibacter woesei (strain DSM 14684 / CCUG 47730 / CIP 108061 / JCM 11494 / NBRC 100937 / ID131577) TaxID=469383 RepID=D3F4B8_CONWI|nr:thiolase family protein [Conexibacter woesei]ADB50490.1 acetyl-CoA acetyltransferase [Conexibacter woesei DSM 14684]